MSKPVIPFWVDLLASISAVAAFAGVAAAGWRGALSQLVYYGSVVCFAITVIAGVSSQFRILGAHFTASPIGLRYAAVLSLRLGAAPWLWGSVGIVAAAVTLSYGDPLLYRLAGLMVLVGAGFIALGIGQWLTVRKTSTAALRNAPPAHPARAPKSASREIFSRRAHASRRKPAYALVVLRKNRCAYDERLRTDSPCTPTQPVRVCRDRANARS